MGGEVRPLRSYRTPPDWHGGIVLVVWTGVQGRARRAEWLPVDQEDDWNVLLECIGLAWAP